MNSILAKNDLPEVHLLRGLAAFTVVIYHLSLGNSALLPDKSIFKEIASFGYLGVEIFFILSGYIICYSLPRNYSFSNFIPFLKKRLTRIYPPYLISIFLLIILNYFSHYLTGFQNSFDWLSLLSNIFLITNFGIGKYLNVVYWTLGIEVQFYIIIALTFTYIRTKYHVILSCLVILIISSLSPIKHTSLIFPYLSLFGVGILIFFYKIKQNILLKLFLLLVSCLLINIYLYSGPAVLITCLFTVFILLFWKKTNCLIQFFSDISFSLYLTHVIIGGKIINLGLRYVNTLVERYLLLSLSIAITISFAYIFFILVERPSILWSKSIKYKSYATT